WDTAWSVCAQCVPLGQCDGSTTGLRDGLFQAEDGTRDHCVPGVQTCALPISAPIVKGGRDARAPFLRLSGSNEAIIAPWPGRSEERRVGKEGRSRGSPDH